MEVKISRKLLEGWKLLNTNCPVCHCPLVQSDDDSKKIYCVRCEMHCAHEDDRTQVAAAITTTTDELYSPNEFNNRTSSNDNVSAKLAEKMLMGWAIMGESCEDCQCPFVRDKEANFHCVSCEAVWRKDGVNGELVRNRKIDNVSASAVQPTKSAESTPNEERRVPKEEHTTAAHTVSGSSTSSSVADAKVIVEQRLSEKLVQCANMLCSTHDLDECARICELMQTITGTLDKVNFL